MRTMYETLFPYGLFGLCLGKCFKFSRVEGTISSLGVVGVCMSSPHGWWVFIRYSGFLLPSKIASKLLPDSKVFKCVLVTCNGLAPHPR